MCAGAFDSKLSAGNSRRFVNTQSREMLCDVLGCRKHPVGLFVVSPAERWPVVLPILQSEVQLRRDRDFACGHLLLGSDARENERV